MRANRLVAALGLVAASLFSPAGRAAEPHHDWSYAGESGPDHWGTLATTNAVCANGIQQSPINITQPIVADLPQTKFQWKASDQTIVNNGHTIQISMPEGSQLQAGTSTYRLLQYHFHAPSEHLVDGKRFPIEIHFVHQKADGKLGVVGVFVVPGKRNAVFAKIAAAFPGAAAREATVSAVDLTALLPANRDFWLYEGSLTTPPCSEVVDWFVLRTPIEVAASDIAKFTALYDHNARPTAALNRRFILGSHQGAGK